jgi:hypothetical protein
MATKRKTSTKPKPEVPGFSVAKRTDINNPDYDYEAVITTEIDGEPYCVGVLVAGVQAYRADKAAAELGAMGVEVSAEFLADIAVAG